MKSVRPTGDCFYDCVDMQLEPDGRPTCLRDAGAMRNHVASSINEEILALYRMYAEAKVEDFAWLTHHHAPRTLEDVQAFARIQGHDAGAGQCLWADEHAMQTIASAAGLCLLIVDEQASCAGRSRSGRKRGLDVNQADSRFILLGKPTSCCLILHRSRRQHYSPVFFRGQGVLTVSQLPAATARLWPKLLEQHASLNASVEGGHASLHTSCVAAEGGLLQPQHKGAEDVAAKLLSLGFEEAQVVAAMAVEGRDFEACLDVLTTEVREAPSGTSLVSEKRTKGS